MNLHNGTAELAKFVVGLKADAIPEPALARAVDAIVDCVGCALAGSREKLAEILRRVLLPSGAANRPAVPLIGSRDTAAPPDAALYNGALAHALDYDDITHPALSHPSAVLVPTLMSLAGISGATGREALAAYVIGIEVYGKLGRALNTAHYRHGWHATSTFGALAGAAAAARLLRLDEAQTRAALGIAGSAAGGLRANFGTMTKPLHCGYAARNAVLAGLLAREGFTATEDVLGHEFGFANAFNGGADIAWDRLGRWGEELEIASEFGLGLKPFPSCAATHPAIEAALDLRGGLGADLDAIDEIRVGVPTMALEPLLKERPATPLQGKFSMQYTVAAALADGAVTLDTFTTAKLADRRIQGLAEKVRMAVDRRVADDTEFASIVEIRTRDGAKHERTVPLAMGKPARWFTRDQLRRKFLDCAGRALDRQSGERAFERLAGLAAAERIESVFEVARAAG